MSRPSAGCRRNLYVSLLQALFVAMLCVEHGFAANELNGNGLSEMVVDQLSENDLYNNNKRAWQSLQNSWGKRADISEETAEDAIYVTGHFVPLLITDGENTLEWGAFQRLANTNTPQGHQQNEENTSELETDDLNALAEKRSWKNMNVAWGKRRQSQNWNKFRGAWGKREPSWNNLKGMWGKRAEWQKLHGGWGKRSSNN